jgi:hypothetical protein
VWRSVRKQGISRQVPKLAHALPTHQSENARREAAANLAMDFRADPQGRAALEAAAAEDPRPMVRAMARRGLLGESAWTEYVVSSLKDANLAPAERMEPLLHTVNQAGKVPDLSTFLNDDSAIEAFADAFARTQATAGRELPTSVLLSRLGSIHHPAITGVLLDSLERTRQPSVRQTIVSQLIQRNRDERVQATLRKLSVEDADPELRQLAVGALRMDVAPR